MAYGLLTTYVMFLYIAKKPSIERLIVGLVAAIIDLVLIGGTLP